MPDCRFCEFGHGFDAAAAAARGGWARANHVSEPRLVRRRIVLPRDFAETALNIRTGAFGTDTMMDGTGSIARSSASRHVRGFIHNIEATLAGEPQTGSWTRAAFDRESFLESAPSDPGIVAIAYDPANPASKQDADTIAGYFVDGLKAGAAMLKPIVSAVGLLAASLP